MRWDLVHLRGEESVEADKGKESLNGLDAPRGSFVSTLAELPMSLSGKREHADAADGLPTIDATPMTTDIRRWLPVHREVQTELNSTAMFRASVRMEAALHSADHRMREITGLWSQLQRERWLRLFLRLHDLEDLRTMGARLWRIRQALDD